jgi:hypothetical protein
VPRPQDGDIVDGIPCTSVALTLLDLAAVAGRRPAERACDEAEVQRLVGLQQLDELLARSRGRRGVATLRAVLAERAIGTTLTRSRFEERTLGLCRRAQLPRARDQCRCPRRLGPRLHRRFPLVQQRVVLETDGHVYHRTHSAIERDRRTEADLVTAGLRVLRSSWDQVEREPDRVARRRVWRSGSSRRAAQPPARRR